MQVTADNADDPGALAMLEDQRAMNELLRRLATSPPVVEFARTADGASVATILGEEDDEEPLVWVARPVNPIEGVEMVELSSVGPVTRVQPRRFPSALDWRNAVPTIAEP